MNFRKRNYQRGRIKRHHQQQLNALIGKKTEAEIKELHQLFLNYETTYKKAVNKFENFIRSKLTKSFFINVCHSSNELGIEKSKIEKEIAAQKMREMNIGFERKSIFGKIFESAEEELWRNKYHSANENIDRLRAQSSQNNYIFDYWSFKNVEGHFIAEFSQEFEKEKKTLAEIGVTVKLDDDGKLNFNLNKDEAAAVVSGDRESDNLDLNLNYTQEYHLFMYDRIAVRDYFKEKFSKISKHKEERNLRALAAEKTDKQRSLASSNRTRKEYENQISIVACCPYCGGNLGGFSGENAANFEHIHPVSKGGLSTVENTVFICVDCNTKKTNMTLNAFIMSFSLDRDAVFDRLHLLGKDF